MAARFKILKDSRTLFCQSPPVQVQPVLAFVNGSHFHDCEESYGVGGEVFRLPASPKYVTSRWGEVSGMRVLGVPTVRPRHVV